MKPFFRWAGGKQRIAADVSRLIGDTAGKRYVEPFVGGGAIFFALEHDGPSHLNDSSPQVVKVLAGVKRDHLEVTRQLGISRELQQRFGHRVHYDVLTAGINSPMQSTDFAAHFLALNQTCFNGLWRVNQREGKFNVPMGYRVRRTNGKVEKLPYDINPLNLTAYSRLLQQSTITCGDYRIVEVERGDVIYCDPPYLKQFTGYNQEPFSTEDHHRELYDWCRRAATKGCRVILSGADNEGTRAIYGEPTVKLSRACTIGCKDRKRVGELLYLWVK